MAIQSLKKQIFRKCWQNREKLPIRFFLKISFAVSENMTTFAVRWSGSLREVPSVAPAYSNYANGLCGGRVFIYMLYMRGVYHESGASRSLFVTRFRSLFMFFAFISAFASLI